MNKDFLTSLKQIFEGFISLVYVLLKYFLTPLWFIIFLVFFIVFKNSRDLFATFSKFGILEYTLLKDYLSIILSLPVVILILGLIFLFKFANSVNVFLQNSNLRKVGPFEVEPNSQIEANKEIKEKIPPSLEKKGIHEASKDKNAETIAIEKIEKKVEFFEFSYLNQILVPNTKGALLWFYFQQNHSSTKLTFLALYQLPAQIVNPYLEKEAIFNALLTNDLIEGNEGLFRVNTKGQKFLRFLGFKID